MGSSSNKKKEMPSADSNLGAAQIQKPASLSPSVVQGEEIYFKWSEIGWGHFVSWLLFQQVRKEENTKNKVFEICRLFCTPS